jgi:hypothetical protein
MKYCLQNAIKLFQRVHTLFLFECTCNLIIKSFSFNFLAFSFQIFNHAKHFVLVPLLSNSKIRNIFLLIYFLKFITYEPIFS